MACIHNALPYKQKQVLPLIIPSTTHPTTITRFQISLDSSLDTFNLGHWSFKTVRMISNNNLFGQTETISKFTSPNVCLHYNKSQPRFLNSNNQKVQHYTVFALFPDSVTLALLFFWQHLLLRTWPFLTVCAVCQSTVFSFSLFSPSFALLGLA